MLYFPRGVLGDWSLRDTVAIDHEPHSEHAMFENDLCYFQRRAEEELERAEKATLRCVVRAHHELAEAYLEKVAKITPVRLEAA